MEELLRLSLKALNYFLKAVEHGSLASAAKELNVVPSAVSAAIDQVEEEFDLKLLIRYPSRGIQPTATGQRLLGKIKRLIEEYESLLIEGGDLKSALTGTLRVGYYAPVAPAFMPTIVAPLLKENKGVSFKFVECNNETAQLGLLSGEFDVILFVAENVKPGISYETLLQPKAYVLTSATSDLASQAVVSMQNLKNEPLVLLDLPVIGEYYNSLFEAAGIEPNIVATASTTEMVRSLVGAGIGSSILNMKPLNEVSYAGSSLIAVPIEPEVKSLKLVLGYVDEKLRRLVQAFVDECRQYFGSSKAREIVVEA